jgi:quercetin dioxygenase-like cupin family protein
MRKVALLLAGMVALGMAEPAMAQQLSAPPPSKPIQRTPLQTFDVPGTKYETVVALVEFVPNVTVGRLTHPGPEAGYILEGEVTLSVKGQPDKRLKAGESFQVPSGVVHDAHSGPRGFKALVTYIVDRAQPLDQRAD